MTTIETPFQVECVLSKGYDQYLTVGKIYTVYSRVAVEEEERILYEIEKDDGERGHFYAERFYFIEKRVPLTLMDAFDLVLKKARESIPGIYHKDEEREFDKLRHAILMLEGARDNLRNSEVEWHLNTIYQDRIF